MRRILDKRVPEGDNQRALVDHNKAKLADRMRELETYGQGRMTNPSLIKAATEMAATQCSTDDNRLSGVSGGGSTFNEATGWMVERHSTINGGGSGARNSMQNIVSHLILFVRCLASSTIYIFKGGAFHFNFHVKTFRQKALLFYHPRSFFHVS